MTLPIPEKALDSHIGFLAKTGAGKSYFVQYLAEWIMTQGRRLCIVDPTDRYWGLRLSRDGKRKGFDVTIFGGRKGDLPLAGEHGAELARLVASTSTPVIISMKKMTVAARSRFFTDFAETLLQENHGPLQLVIDEAHLFAPQGGAKQSGQVPAMIAATNNLVSLGRGSGLRIMLVTQRPAKLHKDSLTQVETLVAMRTIAPQDRAAVKDWIVECADPEIGAELVQSLPSLPTGTAWIWAPELNVLDKIKVPRISTFDSGAPPEEGDEGPELKPIDLTEVRGRLEVVAKAIVENDPKRLKARNAELEAQLAKGGDVEQHRREVVELREQMLEISRGRAAAEKELKLLRESLPGMWRAAADAGADAMKRAIVELAIVPPEPPADVAAAANERQKAESKPAARQRDLEPPRVQPGANGRQMAATGGELHAAARAIAEVLVRHHPARFTWQQAATLAGLKARGGHFNAGRKELRDRELVLEEGGLIGASPAAIAEAGADPLPPLAGAELLEMWCSKLPSPAPEMLRYVVGRGGRPVARDELAEALGKLPRGGHWNSGMKMLRDNGLVESAGDGLRPSSLFLERGAAR